MPASDDGHCDEQEGTARKPFLGISTNDGKIAIP
jgi:hypothetical protein